MPVGAFYGQDGGELARRVSDHARKRSRPSGASWDQEGAFYGQKGWQHG